ncbi:hypothetical protein E4U46_007049 [Claviceps purpurea]|nr:hypothetical protein E4U46_007049 [Claviceps purpurea]
MFWAVIIQNITIDSHIYYRGLGIIGFAQHCFGRAPHLPIVDDLIARSSDLASGFDHDGLGTRSFCDTGVSSLSSDRATIRSGPYTKTAK